jgi:hypothetical protein
MIARRHLVMKCLPLLWALSTGLAHAAPASDLGPSPAQVERFARGFQSALQRHDAPGVAALVAFPLRVGTEGGKARGVGRAELLRSFDKVFTPTVVQAVLSQDPAALFQNYQGVMFGNGEVWAAEVCQAHAQPPCPMRVITVNLPAR